MITSTAWRTTSVNMLTVCDWKYCFQIAIGVDIFYFFPIFFFLFNFCRLLFRSIKVAILNFFMADYISKYAYRYSMEGCILVDRHRGILSRSQRTHRHFYKDWRNKLFFLNRRNKLFFLNRTRSWKEVTREQSSITDGWFRWIHFKLGDRTTFCFFSRRLNFRWYS